MNQWQKIFEASEKGNLVYLQEAQKYVDFRQNLETVFRAVAHGQIACAEFLLPLSDLRAERGEITNPYTGLLLQTATRNNNHAMVSLLLNHSNPKVQRSLALQMASRYADMAMVNLLYDVSEPHVALEDIQQRIAEGIWEPQHAQLLLNRVQRDTLMSHLPVPERGHSRKV